MYMGPAGPRRPTVSAQATRKLTKTSRPRSPFHPVAPPERIKLSDAIVRQIEGMIVQARLHPGDPLPPERELAETMGVSRPSLREALLKLEMRGLVRGRHGGGYMIADVTAPTITEPLAHLLNEHPETAVDILELRSGLEAVAVMLAAERATEADRRMLRQRYARLVKADKGGGDPIDEAEADLEFHLAIVDASYNVALIHTVRGLFSLLRTSIYRFREQICARGDGSDRMLAEQHRAIFDAVMAGDAHRAQEAAHIHLRFVQATLRLESPVRRDAEASRPPRRKAPPAPGA